MIREIGPHRLRCGSIMDGIDDLMKGRRAYMVYSDPPWGKGNLSYWQTMNSKKTPGVVKRDIGQEEYERFMRKFFQIAVSYATDYVLVEYGIGWVSYVLQLAVSAGLTHLGTVNWLYGSGSKKLPSHLHVFSKGSQPVPPCEFLDSLEGRSGLKAVRAAMAWFAKPGHIVLDPCCGTGMTGQVAKENGMVFYGNELIEARLLKAVARLER